MALLLRAGAAQALAGAAAGAKGVLDEFLVSCAAAAAQEAGDPPRSPRARRLKAEREAAVTSLVSITDGAAKAKLKELASQGLQNVALGDFKLLAAVGAVGSSGAGALIRAEHAATGSVYTLRVGSRKVCGRRTAAAASRRWRSSTTCGGA